MDGFQRHFDSQVIIYGKQVIINLVSLNVFGGGQQNKNFLINKKLILN
jgi:hypothetical protein